MADLVAKLGADTSQLQSEIGKAKEALNGYSKEVKDLGKANDKLASAIDKAKRSLLMQAGTYTAALRQANTLKKSIKDLQYQYDLLDKKGKNSSFGKDLRTTMEAAKSKVEELEASIESVDGKLGKLRILNFDMGGNLGKSLKGVTDGVSQQIPLLGKLGPALANPYVAAGAAVVACGAGVAELSSKINEQVNQVQKLTGASQESAVAMRAGVEGVASAYDTDFNETLKASNTLAQSMGISFEEATDLLGQGLASTSIESGEFLDQIKEYAPVLAEAGVSGAGLIDVMNAAALAGIPADKAVDALKEGMLSLREMTPATADALNGIGINALKMQQDIASGSITSALAMQQILAKCNEVGMGSQEVGTIMADVFRGAGEDAGLMLPILANINMSELELSSPLTEYGLKQEELRQATEEWESAMGSLFTTSSGGFNGIVTDIKTGCIKAFTLMIKKVVDCANWFIDLYNRSIVVRSAVEGLKAGFLNTFTVAGAVVKDLWGRIKALGNVLKDVLTLDFSHLETTLKEASNSFKDNWTNAFKEVLGRYKNVVDKTLNGKVKKIDFKVNASVDVEEPKTKGTTKTKTGTASTKGTSTTTPKTNKGKTTSSSSSTPQAAEGSVEALESQLSELQSKYKKGLLPDLSPDDYKSQVKGLQELIKNLKVKLGIEESETQKEFNLAAKRITEQDPIEVKAKVEPYHTDMSDLEDEPVTILEKREVENEQASNKISANDDAINANIEAINKYEARILECQKELDELQGKESEEDWTLTTRDNVEKLKKEMKEAQEAKEKLNGDNDILKEQNKEQKKLIKTNKKATKQDEAAAKAEEEKKKKFQDATSAVGNMGNAFSSLGDNLGVPELNVMGIIGGAIASVMEGYGTATALAGSLGPWAWIAFAITGLATMVEVVSQIKSLSAGSYASGGIIQGATSIGDYNLARVNGGEMILNGTLQQRLFSILDGSGALGKSQVTSGGVDFRIKGRNLVGTLNNYSKRQSKI